MLQNTGHFLRMHRIRMILVLHFAWQHMMWQTLHSDNFFPNLILLPQAVHVSGLIILFDTRLWFAGAASIWLFGGVVHDASPFGAIFAVDSLSREMNLYSLWTYTELPIGKISVSADLYSVYLTCFWALITESTFESSSNIDKQLKSLSIEAVEFIFLTAVSYPSFCLSFTYGLRFISLVNLFGNCNFSFISFL